MMANNPKVVVVGSCMIDFTSYVTRLPKEGETIHSSKFVTAFGGKGANQCYAAAKLGVQAALVARVGDDVWGEKYINNLKDINVHTSFVKITSGFSSGIAQINVADSGANQIVIIAAANTQLSTEDVEAAKTLIQNAEVVVCQLETSPEVAISTLENCKNISILNAAPAIRSCDCDTRLLTLPSIFCVNESEAALLTSIEVKTVDDASSAIKILLEKGCNTVILTLGAQGTVYASKSDPTPVHVPTKSVKSIDSTGAGDAFIGILSYLLAERKDLNLKECIKIANYGAADSVTKPGTQMSFPGKEILEEYFKMQNY